MVVTAVIYRAAFSVAGCYLTAWLAPSKLMLHALILGGIGLVLSTVAAIVTIPMDLGPAWYPITLAVVSLPCGWLGGKLRQKQLLG